jgi:hypothetical protein
MFQRLIRKAMDLFCCKDPRLRMTQNRASTFGAEVESQIRRTFLTFSLDQHFFFEGVALAICESPDSYDVAGSYQAYDETLVEFFAARSFVIRSKYPLSRNASMGSFGSPLEVLHSCIAGRTSVAKAS